MMNAEKTAKMTKTIAELIAEMNTSDFNKFNIKVACDTPEIADFIAYLDKNGHNAQASEDDSNYVEGIRTSTDQGANKIMTKLWNNYCNNTNEEKAMTIKETLKMQKVFTTIEAANYALEQHKRMSKILKMPVDKNLTTSSFINYLSGRFIKIDDDQWILKKEWKTMINEVKAKADKI